MRSGLLLGGIIAVVLVLCLFCAADADATSTDVYVDGTEVNNTYMVKTAGVWGPGTSSNYNIHYDSTLNTITIKDLRIETPCLSSEAGVYVKKTTKLIFEGSSTISCKYGISTIVPTEIRVESDGKLDISSSLENACGIICTSSANLTLNVYGNLTLGNESSYLTAGITTSSSNITIGGDGLLTIYGDLEGIDTIGVLKVEDTYMDIYSNGTGIGHIGGSSSPSSIDIDCSLSRIYAKDFGIVYSSSFIVNDTDLLVNGYGNDGVAIHCTNSNSAVIVKDSDLKLFGSKQAATNRDANGRFDLSDSLDTVYYKVSAAVWAGYDEGSAVRKNVAQISTFSDRYVLIEAFIMYVGNEKVQYPNGNLDDIVSGSGWAYSASKNLLTLTDKTIESFYNDGVTKYGIYSTISIELTLKGANKIRDSSYTACGIRCGGIMKITGSGNLNIEARDGIKVDSYGYLTISNAQVSINAASDGNGIIADNGIDLQSCPALTVTNGICSIVSGGYLNVEYSVVDLSGASLYLVNADDIEFKGSQLTLLASGKGKLFSSTPKFSGYSSGQVTASTVGKDVSMVTYSEADLDNYIYIKAVKGSTDVHVQSIVLDVSVYSLQYTGTYTLTYKIYPENATDKTVKWYSSNQSAVTVDSNGKITGLNLGMSTITVVTNDGGKTSTCTVNVVALNVDAKCTLNDSVMYYSYSGSEIRPNFEIYYIDSSGKNVYFESTEFSASYSNNINVGKASVTVSSNTSGRYSFKDPIKADYYIEELNVGGSNKSTSFTSMNAVPVSLSSKYKTLSGLESYMYQDMVNYADTSILNYRTAYLTVYYKSTISGHDVILSDDSFPAEGVRVYLSWSQLGVTYGTSMKYFVSHMYETDTQGHTAGYVDHPEVSVDSDGISFVLKAASPVTVGWTGNGSTVGGSDYTGVMIIIGAVGLVTLIGVAYYVSNKRR